MCLLSLLAKILVRGFIEKLRGGESHCNRKQSKTVYLAADLNIKN